VRASTPPFPAPGNAPSCGDDKGLGECVVPSDKDHKRPDDYTPAPRGGSDVDAFLKRARAATPAPAAGGSVDAFLDQVRATPTTGRGRLIFAMDATASRQPTWDLAMETQAAMFATATTAGDLAVQLVFYRGMGECKAGPFVTRPDDMVRRMTSVTCRAGRTQIARILRHALKVHAEAPVSALVFIGDCVEEEPDELYGLAGEMGLRKLPAFIFHEGHEPHAAQALGHIARLSGGACCRFDARGPDELRRLLGAVAVYAAGGRPALEDHARKAGGAVLRLTDQMTRAATGRGSR